MRRDSSPENRGITRRTVILGMIGTGAAIAVLDPGRTATAAPAQEQDVALKQTPHPDYSHLLGVL